MTDNEIVKALECCINEDNDLFGCKDCSYKECKLDHDRECSYYMLKDALDLINRQKAEIEELKSKNSNLTSDLTSLQKDLTSAKAELEKNENIIRLADKTIETANAEIEKLELLNGTLTASCDGYIKAIELYKAEIERLQQYYDDMQGAIYEFREDHAKVKFFKKEIKSEAYREFAEKVKMLNNSNLIIWNEQVDNILNELVGEDDE